MHDIRGLTHPGRTFVAAWPMYKKRGRLTATVRPDWVERLFVLSDNAIFWFDMSNPSVRRHLWNLTPE